MNDQTNGQINGQTDSEGEKHNMNCCVNERKDRVSE